MGHPRCGEYKGICSLVNKLREVPLKPPHDSAGEMQNASRTGVDATQTLAEYVTFIGDRWTRARGDHRHRKVTERGNDAKTDAG